MITGIFGKPRSGKTTYAAMMVQKNKKQLSLVRKFPFMRLFVHPYDYVYCTDETIQDTITVDYTNLGKWRPPRNSLLILEEAGIGLNNRNWKALSNDAAYLFALHGHIGCDILWSSQTVDVDKKLLSRTHRLFLCSRLSMFTVLQPISFSVDVDNETHQLVDAYSKPQGLGAILSVLFGRGKIFLRKPWYKYFDSFVDNHEYTMETPTIYSLTDINKETELIENEEETANT